MMNNNNINPTNEKSVTEIFDIIEENEGDINLGEARQGCISVQIPNEDEADE